MSAIIVRLRIFIEHDRFGGDRFIAAFPRDQVSDLIERLLVEARIEDDPIKWELFDGTAVFPPELTVRQLVGRETPLTSWTLRLKKIQPALPPRPERWDITPRPRTPKPPAPPPAPKAPLPPPATKPPEWSPDLQARFADILVKKKLIGQAQLVEALQYGENAGLTLHDAIVKLEFASAKDVFSAVAEHFGIPFVDLTDLDIPKSIIELVPESVARENLVLPLSLDGNNLKIATAVPTNYDTIQKLQFILNKDIVPVAAVPEQIQEAINRHYGEETTESVDSMLVEFTDTAIEFTQTEAMYDAPRAAPPPSAAPEDEDKDSDDEGKADTHTFGAGGDFEAPAEAGPAPAAPPQAPVSAPPPAGAAPGAPLPVPAAPPSPARLPARSAAPALRPPMSRAASRHDERDEEEDSRKYSRTRESAAAPAKKTKSMTERRATVRYYSRMNPDRVFPLLVMLTRHEVEEIVKRHVEQKATGPIAIAKDVPLEIEPVLPGCVCHPPKVVTRLGASDDVFTFHIVPHVQGEVTGARVIIRQDHAVLAEIKLDMRVVQRTLVVASGLSTFVLPAASAAMKHFGLDFTPKDGSNAYLAALNFLFGEVSPVLLTAALAAVTFALYWFTRPKGRDVFWDISTKPPQAVPEN